MSDEYKRLIFDKIKTEINNWIDIVKKKHNDLLLTKQWQILFPKGFTSGHNALAVVTNSKDGKHLVGEVQFVLPANLDLNIDDIELVLKDEPYVETKEKTQNHKPVPIDDSIDILNRLILGINEFVQTISLNVPVSQQLSLFSSPAKSSQNKGVSVIRQDSFTGIDNVKQQMLNSPYLPEWIIAIESKKVYDELIDKLAQAYSQYQKQSNGITGFKDFFEKYEKHLLSHGHLHYYCKYKGKPVSLDEKGHCTELYCSKKPYNNSCPMATLKFGQT